MLQRLDDRLPAGADGGRRHDRVLDRRGFVLVGAAVILLLGIAGASVWQAERNGEALTAAQATRSRRNAATELAFEVQRAETAQRGYLLTRYPSFVDSYTPAAAQIPRLLERVVANGAAYQRIDVLQQAVTAKAAELQQTMTLAQQGNMADAMSIVLTDAGRLDMRTIRIIVAEIQAVEDSHLAAEVGAISLGSRRLIVIDVAGLVMVLALAGLIGLWVRDYLATLRDAQARVAEANATLERHNDLLDEKVRARTSDVLAANEEVQRFAYIVSHDLRAPLVNVMGFTSELEQAAGTLSRHVQQRDMPPDVREATLEEIPEAIRFIKTSTAKMDRLINAILKLSREGRRVLTAEPLDMIAVLGGVAESMQHQAAVKEAAVEVGALPSLVADRLAIEQVFGNVVENALKYLKPGRPGLVRITGWIEGVTARFDITDNGRGIAAKDYERVFELFRRAGDQSVPGEGIGLAHVRALVRRLGGTIDCVSELGTGTTFSIRLPSVATYSQEIFA